MKHIKRFAQEHIYTFSLMAAIMAIGLLYICNFWIFKSEKGLGYDLNRVLAHSIPLIFVLVVWMLSGDMKKLKFTKAGIDVGILLGWLIIADGIYGFVIDYAMSDKSRISMPSVDKTIAFTVVMLLVGIFEEFLCRGIILSNMLKKWGSSKAGIIKAVVLSSLIFGLGHLVNLISAPTLIIRTLTQVMYTSLNGILFASIYLRCKNIWAVAILHAGYDWLVLVSGIYSQLPASAVQVDAHPMSMLVTTMLYIPFALLGLFYLRKVWNNDMSEASVNI